LKSSRFDRAPHFSGRLSLGERHDRTLTIDHQTISGVGTEVDRNGNVQQGDKFSYSAKPIVLANPKSVPTL
jgi:hypothetical protein